MLLAEKGFVRIQDAFSPADASTMSDILWTAFEWEFGLLRSDPQTWDRPFRKRPLDRIGSSPLFRAIFTDRLGSTVSDLLGTSDWQWPNPGEFLISFPNTSSWSLPDHGWHQDWAFKESTDPLRFFKAFVYLNDVEPGGGGTLVVQGSHRLVGLYGDEPVLGDRGLPLRGSARLYQDCEWLRDLCTPGDSGERNRRFVEEQTDVDGVPLKVVELAGKAGDVVIVHPWLIHAIAPNAGRAPRIMRAPVFQADRR